MEYTGKDWKGCIVEQGACPSIDMLPGQIRKSIRNCDIAAVEFGGKSYSRKELFLISQEGINPLTGKEQGQ